MQLIYKEYYGEFQQVIIHYSIRFVTWKIDHLFIVKIKNGHIRLVTLR